MLTGPGTGRAIPAMVVADGAQPRARRSRTGEFVAERRARGTADPSSARSTGASSPRDVDVDARRSTCSSAPLFYRVLREPASRSTTRTSTRLVDARAARVADAPERVRSASRSANASARSCSCSRSCTVEAPARRARRSVGRAMWRSSARSRRMRCSLPCTKFQAPMFAGSSWTHHTCVAAG